MDESHTPPQNTHAHGCWSWGPKHYACARARIRRLEAALKQAAWDFLVIREALSEGHPARADRKAERAYERLVATSLTEPTTD